MGQIITFYSYKGGTGRSMALANIAWLLASNGLRVLVIDWDLEAPGLHRYFKPFLVDPDLSETDGLIDAFWTLATRALTDESLASEIRSPGIPLSEETDWDLEDYINPLKWDFHPPGCIDFIGAGRQGETYSERVNTFDWKRFYQLGGGIFLDRARVTLARQYDYVLIDSRTGVSDTAGICTMQMPDVLVACFTLNNQSIEGVASVLRSVRAWRSARDASSKQTPPRPITFYPVATRIENAEKVKLDLARGRAREVLKSYVPEAQDIGARQYWDDMEITYRPFYAYEEILATFGDLAGSAGSAKTVLSEMEIVGRRVCGRADLAMPEISDRLRATTLQQYAFGPPASKSEAKPVKETSPMATQREDEEENFLKDLFDKEVLWRRSGYRYWDLLSQRELQLVSAEDKAQFGRQMSFFYATSERFPEFQERVNSLFTWIWGGFLAIFLTALVSYYLMDWVRFPESESWLYDNARVRASLRNIAQVLPVMMTVFIFIVTSIKTFSLHRSPSKPYGVRFIDVVFRSILGPMAPEISDYSVERPGETPN